jgi:hypothetical protein
MTPPETRCGADGTDRTGVGSEAPAESLVSTSVVVADVQRVHAVRKTLPSVLATTVGPAE